MFKGQRAPRSSRTVAEEKNDKSNFAEPIVQPEPTLQYNDAAANIGKKGQK
jgi:hypothetical protein